MHRTRTWASIALIAAFAVTNGGCVLVPEMKDRIVELAVGGSTVATFTSTGSTNALSDVNTVDVVSGFDLAQILADAGIDVSNVSKIALAGIEYRITSPDADPSRELTNGAVTIARGITGPLPLVSNFNTGVGAATAFQPAPLDVSGAGVTEVNNLLNYILTQLKAGQPTSPTQTTITYHATGTLSGTGTYSFTWELKVKVTITGTVQVSVPT